MMVGKISSSELWKCWDFELDFEKQNVTFKPFCSPSNYHTYPSQFT